MGAFSYKAQLWDALPYSMGGYDFAITGSRVSDEYPSDRLKGIHAVGNVAKVKFNFNDEPKKRGWTGGFEGAQYAIFRTGPGAAPQNEQSVPAASIKVLRNGVPSGNLLLSIGNRHPNPNANFFHSPLCNNTPMIHYEFSYDGMRTNLIKMVMSKVPVPNPPGMTGLSDFAKYTENGTKAEKIKQPFAWMFMPAKKLMEQDDCKVVGEQFGCMPGAGTEMFKIYAIENPHTPEEIKANPS